MLPHQQVFFSVLGGEIQARNLHQSPWISMGIPLLNKKGDLVYNIQTNK